MARVASARLLPALAFLIAVLLAFGHVLFTDGVLFYRDHTLVFYREIEQVVAAYGAGGRPLWDPTVGGGVPLAAYPNAMAYSPWLVVYALPGSFEARHALFVLAHVAVGLTGGYRLARTLGLARDSAALAGVVFGIGGPLLSCNNLIPALAAYAYMPWVLAAALDVLRAPRPGAVAGFSLALALHVSTAEPANLVGDVLVFSALAPRMLRPGVRVGRGLGALVFGAALAALLAAIQFVPLFELLSDSARGAGFAYSKLAMFSVDPHRLVNLACPGWSGRLSEGYTLFGEPDGRVYLESLYLGASALPLALVGLGRRPVRALGLVAAVLILLALGAHTPLHRLFVDLVPGLSSSRYPVKFLVSGSLAVALLAGFGFEACRQDSRGPLAYAVVLVAGLLALWTPEASLMSDLRPAFLAETAVEALRAGGSWALLFGPLAALSLVLARRGVLPASALRWGVVLLAAVDLGRVGADHLPTTGPDLFAPPPGRAALPETGARLMVYDRAGGLSPPAAEARYQSSRFVPAFGARWGLEYAFDQDLDGNRPSRKVALATAFGRLPESRRIALLGRLGVTHLLTEANVDRAPGLQRIALAPTAGGPPVSIFALERTRPSVSVATRTHVAPTLGAALPVLTSSAGLDLAVVDGAQPVSAAYGPGAREVRLLHRAAGEVRAAFSGTAPGLVVFTEGYAPGWRLEVDGVEAPLMRVDEVLLGAEVPAGAHDLHLVYEPSSAALGLSGTALGLVIVLLLVLLQSRQAPREP